MTCLSHEVGEAGDGNEQPARATLRVGQDLTTEDT